ncbi:unnamed protein product [Prorocentrum cordatum]|uniref:Pentacotripeptide-repeat region of PRORP domain-containing protein n=1 Tax=Prorocentrum cordatum TaxID=2364126 RepID=A0ABN9T9L4_9DINO|nr:unnamed protein product [Polarella glacialis]
MLRLSAPAEKAGNGNTHCQCSVRCWRRSWSPTEMREGKLEPDVILSYSAGISACEKGEQWQRALALLSEMWKAKLEPNSLLQRWDQRVRERRAVAAGAGTAEGDAGGEAGAPRRHLSYNAGISACEKGEQWQRGQQWQRALGLLSEMRQVRVEPTFISYNAGISSCEKCKQWQRALGLLSEMREVKLEPNFIYTTVYNAGISACEKGGQWQPALALLSEIWEAKLPDVISYNAGISACEKGEQWELALALLSEMREAKLEPDVISYSAGISACEKGGKWQAALALLSEMASSGSRRLRC